MIKVLLGALVVLLVGCSSMQDISTTVGVGTTIGNGPISISVGGFKTLKPEAESKDVKKEEEKSVK